MTHHIVFAGTPEFSVPSLEALLGDKNFTVNLVITQPDRPAGRGKKLNPPPIKGIAEKHGIPMWQPEDINREATSDKLSVAARPRRDGQATSCDYLVVVAYGQILKKPLLDWPRIAPLNLHASLLPRWRGASPIAHAILAGDEYTGVTLQRMVEALDEGPVLGFRKVQIGARETLTTLTERLAREGAALLVDTLRSPLRETPQLESAATFCHKLTRKDGDVESAEMTAEEIDRRVRALTPWPGVRCTVSGSSLKLLETSLEETSSSIPLPCRDATLLHLVTVKAPGKREMTGKEWLRGMR